MKFVEIVIKYILSIKLICSIVLFFFLISTFFTSCDKIEKPYLPQYVAIDTTLLYGMTFNEYKNNLWQDFSSNSNKKRNVLIEDFTGHKCINCPKAAHEARLIEEANVNRVFVASIHSGPNGTTGFQGTSGSLFSNDFTNSNGLEIAKMITDGGFIGNPSGTVNRKKFGGQLFQNYSSWANYTSTILNENDLKINLQALSNYFPQTRGVILHTEIELKQSISSDLYQVVYLIEDSLISAQTTPSDWVVPNLDINYVHRDIHRGCIDGFSMGRKLTDNDKKDKNGKVLPGDKYYLNYSYKLPEKFNPENMHFLIYVYDKASSEIYQVIRKNLLK